MSAVMSERPDTESIRRELEATRVGYHQLLCSLPEEDWRKRSGNPAMTVKDLMWHMAWAMGWMARSVDVVKAGRSFNPPRFLVDPARAVAMRLLALRATRDRAAERYDQGHAQLLAKLDAMRDDEWRRQVRIFGEVRDAGWYFQQPARHFEEHASDVRRGLGWQ